MNETAFGGAESGAFSIVLHAVDRLEHGTRLDVAAALRELDPSLTQDEAMQIIDGAPIQVGEGVLIGEATEAAKRLTQAGARAEVMDERAATQYVALLNAAAVQGRVPPWRA